MTDVRCDRCHDNARSEIENWLSIPPPSCWPLAVALLVLLSQVDRRPPSPSSHLPICAVIGGWTSSSPTSTNFLAAHSKKKGSFLSMRCCLPSQHLACNCASPLWSEASNLQWINSVSGHNHFSIICLTLAAKAPSSRFSVATSHHIVYGTHQGRHASLLTSCLHVARCGQPPHNRRHCASQVPPT